MGRLDGKVAIITGGNSGVGAATAVKFAAEGAKVVITARRVAPLEEVAAKIREAGGEVLAIASDISKADDAKKVVADTLAEFGKIDILINNAGVLDTGLKAIDSFTDDDMNKVIDINTKEFGIMPAGLGCRDTLRLDDALHKRDHRLGDAKPGDEHRDARRIRHEELRGDAPDGRLDCHELAVAERRVARKNDGLAGDSSGDSV